MSNAKHALRASEPAVIGRFYVVPCIYVIPENRPYGSPTDGFIPTIGPKHEDADILAFPHEHYHIDWRFVPAAMVESASQWIGKPHGIVITNTHGGHKVQGQLEMKRRKCRREMPDFPAQPPSRSEGAGRKWVLLEEMQSRVCNRLKPGNICPHRGIDLTPFVKPDGTVICPGHGLRWDTKTGNLLAHHGAQA